MDPKFAMEVPTNLRQFAENSVDQAEKAFSAFIDAANKSATMIPGPATDLSTKALSATELNVKAAFDHARRLVHAKDLSEVMQLQSEFLRDQFAAVQEQMKEMSRSAKAPAGDVTKIKPN